MNKHLTSYLTLIQKVCPELTFSEIAQFAEGLTVSTLNKNDVYIKSGEIQNIMVLLSKDW